MRKTISILLFITFSKVYAQDKFYTLNNQGKLEEVPYNAEKAAYENEEIYVLQAEDKLLQIYQHVEPKVQSASPSLIANNVESASVITAEPQYVTSFPSYTDVNYSFTLFNNSIDLSISNDVQEQLIYFSDRTRFINYVNNRADEVLPIFEQILLENNLPLELKYLPILESGLNVNATSPVGAKGMWQFMKATARQYGLDVNKKVDERKDMHKSTYAAVKYLKYLHNMFGDWHLALAAYNCGEGNVQRCLKRSGGSSFDDIKSYLPRETQLYVPRFIAIVHYFNQQNTFITSTQKSIYTY